MFVKNLTFVAVCLAGLGALAFSLSPSRPPQSRSAVDAVPADADLRATLSAVNAVFRDSWQRSGLTPAPPADDLTVARRLALALAGTIPSLEEIRLLESRPANERIEWWLAGTLADRRTSDYLAERLARAFVGTEEGPFLLYRRRRFVAWLADRLQENTPYDEIVRHLIADEGLWTDEPAVNFVTVTIKPMQRDRPDVDELAARTARAFLGTRIDCAQCHDHPFERWKQADFEGLAAFYAGVRQQNVRGLREVGGAHEVEDRKTGAKRIVAPRVPFDEALLPADGSPRRRLAAWVTHRDNRAFARAAVNRAWALVFGEPLLSPVDDVGLETAKSAEPEQKVLDLLAADFAGHGYDLRRLLRAVASTEAFRLDSRVAPSASGEADATDEHRRAWAVFPLTRLRPEQTIDALLQAAGTTTLDRESHAVVQLTRYFNEREFVRRYGDAGEDELAPQAGTIPQRLLMMNGKLVREKLRDPLMFDAAARIAAFASSNEQAVEAAYLAVLTRRPTPREREHFVARLADPAGGGRRAVVEDLFWALFNSTEFAWNH